MTPLTRHGHIRFPKEEKVVHDFNWNLIPRRLQELAIINGKRLI